LHEVLMAAYVTICCLHLRFDTWCSW